MGDETDKKQQPTPKKEQPKAAGEITTNDAASQTVDFAELDEAYENAATAQTVLMNKRGIGIREVHGNLNEADSPSLADELLKVLAVAGLAFASQYVAGAIVARTAIQAGSILAEAVTEAIHTAQQEAAGAVGRKLAEVEGQSKATFFASQEEGLETLRQAALKAVSAEKKKAKGEVQQASSDKQAKVLDEKVKGARAFETATTVNQDFARNTQYRESLSKWMNALSQGKLGEKHGGTDLGKAVDMSPKDHFARQGAQGVIYIAFASQPARRPVSVGPERIKVSGMTQAAVNRIKTTPIKDLGMPIVASGYFYDGALDQLYIANNEIAFGKNEGNGVWWKGHDNAVSAMKKAAGQTDAIEAARIILDEDLGKLTLDGAHV